MGGRSIALEREPSVLGRAGPIVPQVDPFVDFRLLGREFLFGRDALVAQFGEFPSFVARIRGAVRRGRASGTSGLSSRPVIARSQG
jgi:hypothetical protein